MEPNSNVELQEKQWTTRDGRKLYPYEMMTEHLRSALAHIKRHDPNPHICNYFDIKDEGVCVDCLVTLSWRSQWIEAFEAELKKREEKT
jgi:hypothetical protein